METKEMKGITLVALVVTIVVLLILAGVSINLVLGDNGIITRAKEAREKSAEATENDLKGLNGIIDQIDAALEESTYPETVPYLPSDDFHYDESTSIDTGLVIQDSDGNEYVWVVVPRRKSIYKTTGLGKTEFTQEDYENIKGDYTSNLLYGIQFELVMKFMSNDTSKITSTDVLKTDSKSIGNYRDSSFDLDRGKYAQYGQLTSEWNDFDKELGTIVVKNEKTGKMQKKEQSENKNSILLTTGATEHSRVMNIYDMAGNVGEWLYESTINAYGNPCPFTGGRYFDYKVQVYRTFPTTLSDSDSDIGFRVAIY